MKSPPTQPLSIGIDVGGTHTRVGVVSADQSVVTSRHLRTRRLQAQSDFVEQLAILIQGVCHDARIADKSCTPIGLAVPGIIDRESGVVVRSVNLPFLEQPSSEESVVRKLSRRVGQPVTLMTDADAAAWGEYKIWRKDGQREDERGFLHLRLGTGVACSLIAQGQFQPLPRTGGGHLDDLVVNSPPDALLCACGQRGCLENYVSGPALQCHAEALGYTNGLTDWEKASAHGDPTAIASLDRVATFLSRVIENLQRRYQNPIVVLGGGVFSGLPGLFSACKKQLLESAESSLMFARLGDLAGVVGAALLAKH
ncbi:MAG: ROK family protein [Planctomycetota bacterium]